MLEFQAVSVKIKALAENENALFRVMATAIATVAREIHRSDERRHLAGF